MNPNPQPYMKAYMVFNDDPYEGCLLVFAETANKARYMTTGHSFEWEYVETSARRAPDYDQYANKVKRPIVDCNEDLPENAEPFYSEMEW